MDSSSEIEELQRSIIDGIPRKLNEMNNLMTHGDSNATRTALETLLIEITTLKERTWENRNKLYCYNMLKLLLDVHLGTVHRVQNNLFRIRNCTFEQRLDRTHTVDVTCNDKACSCNEKACSICLETFKEKEGCNHARVLPCLHQFWEECIREWMKNNNTCPECRGRIFCGV